jgi:hypothetical protein
MRRESGFGLVVTLALALAGLGCKQGFAERCEQNSDCSSGICSTMMGPPSAEGGRCCASTGCGPVGGGGSDAAVDMASGSSDAGDDVSGDASDDVLSSDGPAATDAGDASRSDLVSSDGSDATSSDGASD